MALTKLVPWLFSRKQTPLLTIAISGTRGDAQIIDLEYLPDVIGRSSQADVCVLDRWVSKIHCWVDVVDGRLLLHDAESTHGTVVDGETTSKCALEAGDRILIGMTNIEIVDIADGDSQVTGTFDSERN